MCGEKRPAARVGVADRPYIVHVLKAGTPVLYDTSGVTPPSPPPRYILSHRPVGRAVRIHAVVRASPRHRVVDQLQVQPQVPDLVGLLDGLGADQAPGRGGEAERRVRRAREVNLRRRAHIRWGDRGNKGREGGGGGVAGTIGVALSNQARFGRVKSTSTKRIIAPEETMA